MAYCELDDRPWLLRYLPVDGAGRALDLAETRGDLGEVTEDKPSKVCIAVALGRQVAHKDARFGRKPHLRLLEHDLSELDVVVC